MPAAPVKTPKPAVFSHATPNAVLRDPMAGLAEPPTPKPGFSRTRRRTRSRRRRTGDFQTWGIAGPSCCDWGRGGQAYPTTENRSLNPAYRTPATPPRSASSANSVSFSQNPPAYAFWSKKCGGGVKWEKETELMERLQNKGLANVKKWNGSGTFQEKAERKGL